MTTFPYTTKVEKYEQRKQPFVATPLSKSSSFFFLGVGGGVSVDTTDTVLPPPLVVAPQVLPCSFLCFGRVKPGTGPSLRPPAATAVTTTPFAATSRITDFHNERRTLHATLFSPPSSFSALFYFPYSFSFYLFPCSALPDGTTPPKPHRRHHQPRRQHPPAVTAI